MGKAARSHRQKRIKKNEIGKKKWGKQGCPWHFVKQYVWGYATCQANKSDTSRSKPPLFPISPAHGATPFSTIAVDWIKKLPESQGFDSIMTITDHNVSKMAMFIPCQENQGAEEMAWMYIQNVFPYYGLPDHIISDQDPQIMSQFFTDVCTLLEILKNTSTAYHPQTDGQSECTNQTLETFLQIYCNHRQDDWARYLPLAQFAINSRPSMTTKHFPFEVLMGFLPKGHQVFCQSRAGKIMKRLNRISQLCQEVELNIKHAQELAIKGSNFKLFAQGQNVWLDSKNLKTTHPATKLHPKCYGPFTVTKVISHVTYQLDLPSSWKIHNMFHASLLSPYKEIPEHGQNFPEPPLDLIEGEQEWEVERIVGMRQFGCNKKLQYRIRWKGYSEAHDSWEPTDNIHAPDLMATFHQENQSLIVLRGIITQLLDDKDGMSTPPTCQ